MEELFFVVDPVWWINSIQTTSILIALIWGGILGIYLSFSHKKGSTEIEYENPKYHFKPIQTSDPEYAGKTLDEIRKYLAYRYNPNHCWAHILDEIQAYSKDTRLIEIIKQLESIEYSHENINHTELNAINLELIKKLQT